MNGKNFYLSEEYMQKNTAANAAAAAHAAPKTCAAHGKKTLTRVSIFSPWRNKMVSVKPYGPTAKKLYKFYIQELGYDAAWIAPADLRFYEESGRFRRIAAKPKAAKAPKVQAADEITSRLSYKSYLSCHTLNNLQKVPGYDGFELLRRFRPQLEQALAQHGGLKVYPAARCVMNKTLAGDVIGEIEDFYVTSGIVQLTVATQIDAALGEMISGMTQRVPEQETQGSGWVFQRVSTLEVHLAKFKPLKGSSYFPLPKALASKKAIVNVKNADDQCFKWAVLSALFPVKKNTERLSNYLEHEDKLDWGGLSFPVSVKQIALFEKRNRICLNVYGCDVSKERCQPFLLQKSKFGAEAQTSIETRAGYTDEEWDVLGAEPLKLTTWRQVNLLLLEEGEKSHYCWIKSFSRFARQPSDRGNAARHFCHYCLHGFPSAAKLTDHLRCGCREITEARPVLPEPGSDEAFTEFRAPEKQHKAPFVIYADFEALTEPVSKAIIDPSKSYTDAYQTHTPCGFCIHTVSADPSMNFTPIVYRGENTIQEFIFKMKELEEELVPLVKACEPLVMTAKTEREFQCAKHCCFCKKPLESDRVRDHDHLTGQYRGAAHNVCNLEEGKKRTRRYTIPVFFHNLKGYDSHLIMSEVGKHTSKLSAIPQNFEKMISFSFSHLRFLDSQAFLTASVETLVSNLYADGTGKDRFIHSARHCPKPQHLDLLLKKGVYPYDYMSGWDRFGETKLPAKKHFYSKLSESDISDEQYQHAQRVWRAFDCKTLGDYHDLYVLTDVLLLADVFEAFREVCLPEDFYGLDPAHYFTLPNFAWDAMLKKTGVKLELLTDYDQYLMIEQGLRGGVAVISHRHAEANNPEMGEGYDKDREHSYISYLDANNLYGHAMVQPLPCGDFQWEQERDADALIARYASNPDRGCIVKCDLEYPEHLHDSHNDYPLAPERKLVTQEMLSPYASELQRKLEIGRDTMEKLVPNLEDKHDYVVDIRNLKFYLDHGLKVKKVSSVISFEQSTWLKPYIDFNTERRKEATDDFSKDLFKLLSNAVFGKTMENVRMRVNMSFVTSNAAWGDHAVKQDRTIERKVASPLYDGHMIYNDDLAAIKLKKKELILNKPIYAGMCILDLSKRHMYEFHYDVIRPKYGDRAKLLFTDTDSLCYHIRTENVFEDQKARSHLFDLSNYPADSPYRDDTNKKVLGKFKDEMEGKSASSYIGLRPKMYSIKCGAEEKKTAKGVKRAHVKNNISHADYRRCLLSEERSDNQQIAKFNTIRSKSHQVQSLEISKVGLCCYDNKRFLLEDGIESYAYGHYKIAQLKSLQQDRR